MKRTLLSTLTACALLVGGVAHASDDGRATETQPSLMGSHAAIGVGVAAREGQTGYYIDLGWQINDYAQVQFAVDSYLNKTTYNAKGIEPDFDEDVYGAGNFRPRHNNYTLGMTARYPYQLTDTMIMAPYLEFAFNKMSTKDVTFEPLGTGTSSGDADSGDNSGGSTNTKTDLTLNFQDVGSFKVGGGFQLAFSDTHKWTFGAIAYSTDESWSDLEFADDQVGGSLRYEYRPADRLGFVFKYDSVDQFGNPFIHAGINWAFR